MKRLIQILLVSAALVLSNQAMGFDGMSLNKACADKGKGWLAVSCLSFIRGVSEGLVMGLALAGKLEDNGIYCPPKNGLGAEQARLIVEKYFRGHPEKLNENAASLVGDALLGAFPCHKRN